MTPNDPIPTTADVDRAAALPDPMIRNLQITQCYHELAAVLAARASGTNWCIFATWASRQAGQTIRKEDFARVIITEYLMTIGPPQGVILHLGQDLPVEFPPSLKQITLPDLQALLARIDPTPD